MSCLRRSNRVAHGRRPSCTAFPTSKQGYLPNGDVVFDKSGNLYGATVFGGTKGTTCDAYYGGQCGVVFEISPPKQKGGAWTQKVLHNFPGIASGKQDGDGAEPNGGLVLDSKGTIYGTSYFGGNGTAVCGSIGCGTVFSLTPPTKQGGVWTEKILHRFSGPDGAEPACWGHLRYSRQYPLRHDRRGNSTDMECSYEWCFSEGRGRRQCCTASATSRIRSSPEAVFDGLKRKPLSTAYKGGAVSERQHFSSQPPPEEWEVVGTMLYGFARDSRRSGRACTPNFRQRWQSLQYDSGRRQRYKLQFRWLWDCV